MSDDCTCEGVPDDALVTGVVTITRYLATDGADVVYVETADGSDNRLSDVESLGLISFANMHVYDRIMHTGEGARDE